MQREVEGTGRDGGGAPAREPGQHGAGIWGRWRLEELLGLRGAQRRTAEYALLAVAGGLLAMLLFRQA
ncbi:MAG: hypothetical protein IRY95_04460, partial [Clostridia bacterium]|nr:hypothetical protein [Clostridia bacterium]